MRSHGRCASLDLLAPAALGALPRCRLGVEGVVHHPDWKGSTLIKTLRKIAEPRLIAPAFGSAGSAGLSQAGRGNTNASCTQRSRPFEHTGTVSHTMVPHR